MKTKQIKVKYTTPSETRYVQCSYQPSDLKDYTFKTTDNTVSTGDLLLVPTDTRWGITVVKVVATDVKPKLALDKIKSIIGKVAV